MIVKHEQSGLVKVFPSSELSDFFCESVAACRKLKALYTDLEKFEQGELDEDDISDVFDDFRIMTDSILRLGVNYISCVNSLNKYLNQTTRTLEVLLENINKIVEFCQVPDESSLKILKKEIFSVIGGLSYFLINDFSVFNVLKERIAGEPNVEIDEIFNAYIEKYNADIDEFGQWLLKTMADFRIHLEIFDAYPELERQFEEVVGPDYNLIPEGVLTKEIVLKVIEGEMSISELLEDDD